MDFRVMQKGYGLFSKALKDIGCFLQMVKDIPENVKGIHINASNTLRDMYHSYHSYRHPITSYASPFCQYIRVPYIYPKFG